MARCGRLGNARHWFSLPGWPGLRCPVCVRCGAPNPRPLTDAEWAELAGLADSGDWPVPRVVREALDERRRAPARWLLHRALDGPDRGGCEQCAAAGGPAGCCPEGAGLRAAARAVLGQPPEPVIS